MLVVRQQFMVWMQRVEKTCVILGVSDIGVTLIRREDVQMIGPMLEETMR